MKNLKICLGILCLLPVLAVGTSQFIGANSFMKLISLDQGRKGFFAQVDDEDFEVLNSFIWRTKKAHKMDNLFYAVRCKLISDPEHYPTNILMHRQILDCTRRSEIVDHKDRNGLNNQRLNIRKCTLSQNNANRQSRLGKTSKYLGVCYVAERKRWVANISQGNKSIPLGRFQTEIEAALAYNRKAKEIHGEFANLNKV